MADHVIDIGPGAGDAGGSVVFQGTMADLRRADTPTGRCLSRPVTVNTRPRKPTGLAAMAHVSLHNLRDVSVRIPRVC